VGWQLDAAHLPATHYLWRFGHRHSAGEPAAFRDSPAGGDADHADASAASFSLLPISILLLTCFALGFGLLLSALAIFFPDVAEMYQILLMAWMYLTPVIYPEDIIPAQFQTIYRLNPMYWMVKMFRLPVYNGVLPTFQDLWPAVAWSVGMLVVGWLFFTSRSDEYAYRV